jgi:hypothetical protein
MAKEITFEDARTRFERYTRAKSHIRKWDALLQEAYRYTLPNKDNFEVTHEPGDARNNEIFDATAVEAVQGFANNMQAALMPPLQRWASFEAGTEVPKDQTDSVNAQLESINEKFFRILTNSNLSLVVNEAFQELAVGTAVILLNEGTTSEDPIIFTSIPLTEVVMEEGPKHTLENFWRLWKGPIRLVLRNWPKAELTPSLQNQLKSTPNTEVKLIEGTIFYPDNPPDKQYLYYVQVESGTDDILKEWRNFSPWIGFRYTRAPGEILGRGPVIQALPFIKQLNKIAELIQLGAQYRVTPPFLVASSGALNPYSLRIEPGSIVAVDQTASLAGGPPIQTLEYGGQVSFAQAFIENLQANIRDMLFSNPLGPVAAPKMTATEVTIRQQQAVQKTGAAFGRLLVELLEPIVEKVLIILKDKGLIEDVVVNDKEVAIRYESPLANIQNQEDIQAVQTWIQLLLGTFQEPGLAATNFEKLPAWWAQKLAVPAQLINQAFPSSPLVQRLKRMIAQGSPESQAPPSAVGEIPSPQSPVTPEQEAAQAAQQPTEPVQSGAT